MVSVCTPFAAGRNGTASRAIASQSGLNVSACSRSYSACPSGPVSVTVTRTGRGWWFYEDTPEGIVRTQPYAGTGDDWWKKCKPRAQVYASMGLSAA